MRIRREGRHSVHGGYWNGIHYRVFLELHNEKVHTTSFTSERSVKASDDSDKVVPKAYDARKPCCFIAEAG